MLLNEFFGSLDFKGPQKEEENNKKKYDDNELIDSIYEFIINNDKLHKEEFIPVAQKINNHPTTEHDAKEWLPLVNKGCMEFYHAHKMMEDPLDLFSKDIRKKLCQKFASISNKEILKGEYDLGK